MGLIEWWKIMPNTKDKSHDEEFMAYMDSTITVAENLYKNYPAYKTEAAFFLSAANDNLLAIKVSELLPLNGSVIALLLVTGTIGGLVSGFASLSGNLAAKLRQ